MGALITTTVGIIVGILTGGTALFIYNPSWFHIMCDTGTNIESVSFTQQVAPRQRDWTEHIFILSYINVAAAHYRNNNNPRRCQHISELTGYRASTLLMQVFLVSMYCPPAANMSLFQLYNLKKNSKGCSINNNTVMVFIWNQAVTTFLLTCNCWEVFGPIPLLIALNVENMSKNINICT